MNVRDLITNLLDYDMEAEVEIRIESKENTDSTSDFNLVEEGYTGSKYLSLTFNVRDQVLVDESDFNDLKVENAELTSVVESLESKLEDVERLINELEGV